MDYRTYVPGWKERVEIALGLGSGLMVTGYLFYDSLMPLVLLPALFTPVEKLYCSYKRDRILEELRLGFKDMLYSLSSAFLSGRHMREALEKARVDLMNVYPEDHLIVKEAEYLLKVMDEPGMTEEKAMMDLSRRADIEDIRDFVTAYRMMIRSGGDIASVMNRCAGIILEKISAEADIREMVSQKKLEGKMITLMPALVILFLKLSSPGYLDVMYGTLAGRILMTGTIVMIVAAYVMMERITSIDV